MVNYLDYFLVIFPLVVNGPQREWVQIMKRNLNFVVVDESHSKYYQILFLPWSGASHRRGIQLQI